jgi:predicted small lipoprotein YifL
MQLKPPALLACVLAACLLCACGQTGSLYLPDAGVTTPVEIRPAPTTAPESSETEKAGDEQTEGKAAAPAPQT